MNVIQEAQGVLDHLALAVGLESLTLDQGNRASYTHGGMSYLFYALEAEEQLAAVIYIGKVDLADADLLYEILCGNHLWAVTGGGHLSIDRATGHLCLFNTLDLPLEDRDEVISFMGDLMGAATHWKTYLPGEGRETPVAEAHYIRV